MSEYLVSSINDSSVIAETVGAGIENAPHKAVMYNGEGKVVLATDAAKAFGVILSSAPAAVKAGDTVTVQIKDIGLAEAGGAVAKGELVSIKNGCAVKNTGGAVFGRAFSAASAAGELIQVQILPCGAPASSV